MKLLVVEDNEHLAKNTRDFLVREGYICEIADTADAAREKISLFQYDLIILDIMLPDGNGLKLLELIRQEQQQGNVLITSAKNSIDDKVTGLELGADDYLTKPFHLSELHARIRAIYRRKNLQGSNLVQFREISLNTDTLEVTVNQSPMEVTRKEFDLLLYFIVNKNRVLSRQSIAAHLWGDYTEDLANFDFVYQHVKNLRKKISAVKGADYISTVYGIGYKFNDNES
ncbi:response regulator transcription factor [Flavihumibacter petaseus]|uniref:Putative two-component response regulator n=1 Tax=Flavihumibacter petaseus NBRC 106054 TaxID=1220578 RepID=A0A0E9N733_9BACT|nr:response regulator transcription factor [Flavihumibacter petaseus]GAO45506.1 putative two-component response regulator [Flavihumibacter petaseus NBRC 106054]